VEKKLLVAERAAGTFTGRASHDPPYFLQLLILGGLRSFLGKHFLQAFILNDLRERSKARLWVVASSTGFKLLL